MAASFRNVREPNPNMSVSPILTRSSPSAHLILVIGRSHTLIGFRQVGEIKALAGVDFLTISPSLLEELKNSTDPVPKRLDAHGGYFSLIWVVLDSLLRVRD